ncbi:SDR family NAD(P)-dependent oxidoreductase [Shewanella sp. A25]|nr:SDR family NAD(P)-dependent oxidoreductase [Shewanella shenzhenensis]
MEQMQVTKKSVAVVGCGWFGFALAKHLVEKGFRVTGAKQQLESLTALRDVGIEAYQLQLGEGAEVVPDPAQVAGLLETDFLVVNIPPRLKQGNSNYLNELKQLLTLTQNRQYQCIVFISTTGVYPTESKTMTEADARAESQSAQILLDAEALFDGKPETCVVRFAGLVGPKRHPGRFFAGKTDVSGGTAAVNLVHLEDCVVAVTQIIEAKVQGIPVAAIYNVCAPQHPTRAEFYTAAAEDLGLIAPTFNQVEMPSKIISSEALQTDLHFRYRFASPLEMLAAC